MREMLMSLVLAALVPAGTALSAEGSNPVTGRQSRTETFEFAAKPKVEKRGGKYVISFASKAACDATVAIVGPSTSSGQGGKGKVVRHLASGVLGKNAPAPFKQNSLQQSIEWDGKDDRGKPVPAGCKVKVSLGLKANLDRFLGWSPEAMPIKSLAGIAAGPNGDVFLLTEAHEGSGLQSTTINVYVYGRDGKYKRRLLPPPSHLPPEKSTILSWVKTTWGADVPVRNHSYIMHSVVRNKEWANVPLQGPVVTPGGKFIFLVPNTRRAKIYSLIMVNTKDGATPAGSIVSVDLGVGLGFPLMEMAVSPDGKWLYLNAGYNYHRGSVNKHAVWRISLQKPAEARVFLGEPSKAGSDKEHFNGPRGMACDKDGNLYVADLGNNRVQVFKPDGSLLKTINSKEPHRVAVSHKTGEIYLLHNRGAKLVKLGGLKDPAVKAQITVAGRVQHAVHIPRIALDQSTSPASIWIATGSLGGVGSVRRYEERGGKFVDVARAGVKAPKGWRKWGPWTPSPYLEADPLREELYIRYSGMCMPGNAFRVDGRTGKLLEKFDFMVGRNSTTRGRFGVFEECVVGPDGLVYFRLTTNGRWIARYDPDKHEFVSRPGDKHAAKLSFKGKPVMGFKVPHKGTGFNFTYPMGVAPNGDLYVPCRPTKEFPEKLGLKGWYTGNKDNVFYRQLRVYSSDGKLKSQNVLPGLGVTDGVRIGKSGAVYIVMSCQPLKNKVPEGIAAGKFPRSVWGTLVKFNSSLGKYPVGKVVVDKARGTHYWHRLGAGNNVRMEGVAWDFGGVGPVPFSHCHCWKSKFDLDGFERVFLPAAPTCTVNVLDANGNIVVRLGGYGNADCMGKDSPVVDPKTGQLRPRRKDDPAGLKSPLAKPELGFLDPSYVAVTDEAVYVHDRGNERIVRAKLGYHAEETVAVP
jgi:SMP-30/Gluconolactonase/LRE-like region